jgi:enamine deaminase RidA (YjgF/YER057c/UK114 family)
VLDLHRPHRGVGGDDGRAVDVLPFRIRGGAVEQAFVDYARFNELYRGCFPDGRYPTRSTVAVKDLARGARLELTMTAVRSKSPRATGA